jgi:hypothetical protein
MNRHRNASSPVFRAKLLSAAVVATLPLFSPSSVFGDAHDAAVSAQVRALLSGSDERLQSLLPSHPRRAPSSKMSQNNAVLSVPVTHCLDDQSAGSLRSVVARAGSGDTIDMTKLTCSTITLVSGAINVPMDKLTIKGPTSHTLTINANHHGRAIEHTVQGGSLELSNLTIANGKISAPEAFGGCIYSQGDVSLYRSTITSCALSGGIIAAGGGIFAAGDVDLTQSDVTNNVAQTIAAGSGEVSASGGGVFVRGQLRLGAANITGNVARANLGEVYGGGVATSNLISKYSTVSANQAESISNVDDHSSGGGILVTNQSLIFNTTIDHNIADLGGGMLVGGGDEVTNFVNTTISSNTAHLLAGGLLSTAPLRIGSSTIAFNSAGAFGAGGLLMENESLEINSTIAAENSPSDLDVTAVALGGANLIRVAGIGSTMPPGTLTGNPLLAPLAFNGGRTRTHAIAHNSPAVNAGINSAGSDNDQRGEGFVRVAGSKADIGAFEFDGDRIFSSSFE